MKRRICECGTKNHHICFGLIIVCLFVIIIVFFFIVKFKKKKLLVLVYLLLLFLFFFSFFFRTLELIEIELKCGVEEGNHGLRKVLEGHVMEASDLLFLRKVCIVIIIMCVFKYCKLFVISFGVAHNT